MNIGGRLADQRAALERHQRSSEELARAMALTHGLRSLWPQGREVQILSSALPFNSMLRWRFGWLRPCYDIDDCRTRGGSPGIRTKDRSAGMRGTADHEDAVT
jgi:hypothetical protein